MSDKIEYAPDYEVVETSKLKLPEKVVESVEVKSGEEDEDMVYHERVRLFLFYPEDRYGDEVRKNIWKERGTGELRILKHKTEKKERMVMRQEKTFKLILNHVINPLTLLKENPGSDRSWCFFCEDYAEGELKKGYYAIRFKDHDASLVFKKHFDEARKVNAEVFGVAMAEDESTKSEPEKETATESATEPEPKKE